MTWPIPRCDDLRCTRTHNAECFVFPISCLWERMRCKVKIFEASANKEHTMEGSEWRSNLRLKGRFVKKRHHNCSPLANRVCFSFQHLDLAYNCKVL
jgi:hypothetical protein